jgi:hypothetical protein
MTTTSTSSQIRKKKTHTHTHTKTHYYDSVNYYLAQVTLSHTAAAAEQQELQGESQS